MLCEAAETLENCEKSWRALRCVEDSESRDELSTEQGRGSSVTGEL